jgi:hypothetical protein
MRSSVEQIDRMYAHRLLESEDYRRQLADTFDRKRADTDDNHGRQCVTTRHASALLWLAVVLTTAAGALAVTRRCDVWDYSPLIGVASAVCGAGSSALMAARSSWKRRSSLAIGTFVVIVPISVIAIGTAGGRHCTS